MLCLPGHRLIQKNDKFCTIAKFNVSLCLSINLSYCRSFRFIKLSIIDLFTKETIICTMIYFQESLSARVHYSCFFQNRKHLRCLRQSFLCMSNHTFKECIQILCCLCNFNSFRSCFSCNSKNCSFFRFHNRLVCSLHTFLHRCCDSAGIQFLAAFNALGKTTKKLGKDNT